MSVVKEGLYRVWDALHYLFGDGGWKLNSLEQLVAKAAICSFAEEIQGLLEAQIQQRYFVERMSKGRINVLRFYSPDRRLTVQDPRFADMLVVVRIAIDGREQDAHVVFLRGYLFSIEFRDKAAFYANRAVEVRSVRIGNPKKTYTRSIDRVEHGSEGE